MGSLSKKQELETDNPPSPDREANENAGSIPLNTLSRPRRLTVTYQDMSSEGEDEVFLDEKLQSEKFITDGSYQNNTCFHRVLVATCTATVLQILSLRVLFVVLGFTKGVIGIYFINSCSLAPSIPVYLIVSGIIPAAYILACSFQQRKFITDEKSPEDACPKPKEKKLEGRWDYAATKITFDTKTSWQTGLAAVLTLFILIWLVYGTIIVLRAFEYESTSPTECSNFYVNGDLPTNTQVMNGDFNLSSSSSSDMASNYSSTTSASSSGLEVSSSTTNLLNSSSSASAAEIAEEHNHSFVDVGEGFHTTEASSRDELYIIELSENSNGSQHDSNHDASLNVSEIASSDGDISCAYCDQIFLTMSFWLVMADWAYIALLVLNLILLGCLPTMVLKCCHTSSSRDFV